MSMDEASLINHMKSLIKKRPGRDVVLGIGDDTAVLKQKRGKLLLATCDSLVESVHFKRESITPENLGFKLITVNASDIAAMGAIPKHILVSLVLPKQITHSYITALYRGINRACRTYNIDVIGGNISSGETFVLDGFLLGEISPKYLVTRNGAKDGDMVLVTGTLGEGRNRMPIARVREAQIIARSGWASAMIDISDGLSTDLLHICDASNVGVRIFAKDFPTRALYSGEDYELCFTVPEKYAEEISREITKNTHTRVSIIGQIIKRSQGRWLVDKSGRRMLLEPKGWDHFSSKFKVKS